MKFNFVKRNKKGRAKIRQNNFVEQRYFYLGAFSYFLEIFLPFLTYFKEKCFLYTFLSAILQSLQIKYKSTASIFHWTEYGRQCNFVCRNEEEERHETDANDAC